MSRKIGPQYMVCSPPDTGELEKQFRYDVFKLLKVEGKTKDAVIENMINRRPARKAHASESATGNGVTHCHIWRKTLNGEPLNH